MCVSVRKVYCCRTAEWIWMLFGMVSAVGQGMGVLDGGGDCRRGRGSFWSEFWASHCIQCGLCCIVVHKCINWLSCRLGWWVVSPGIGVLDGVNVLQAEGGFGGFFPYSFQWRIIKQKCIIRFVGEKLSIFPYGQDIVGNAFSLASWWYNHVQDQNGDLQEICKNVTVVTCKKSHLIACYSRTTSWQ